MKPSKFNRPSSAARSILLVLLGLLLALPLSAQDETNGEAEEEQQVFGEEIVVVGSRAQPRSVTESSVPVDVIQATELMSQGDSDITNRLRTVVPSYNVGTQPISDAATLIRPVNLRGLAPDHSLILVNGKRRHRAAVIAWLGNGVSDGSQGPDISVIPSIALRQVEVLRDGASAQYGSDAIAGVLNFALKDARSGGSIEIRSGQYADSNPGSSDGFGGQYTFAGDNGQAYAVAANFGMPMGADGFFNLSLEYGAADPTSRSVQRNDAQGLIDAGNTDVRNPAQVWGSPLVEDDVKLFANFGNPLGNGNQFYGHANYATRTITGGFYFRNPHTRTGVFSPAGENQGRILLVGDREWARTGVPFAGGCPEVAVVDNRPDPVALAAVEADPNCFTLYSRFPGGFTPQFGGDLTDYSLVAGMRGYFDSGLTWDLSANIGTSEIDQFIYNTVNASLGYDTPTSFKPGVYEQTDTNVNFDITYPVRENVNLAAGVEWRNEEFRIGAGDPASWEIGPYAEQGFGSGSNGFNGYRADVTAGTWDRANVAVYTDIEVKDPDASWTYGAAVRIEEYDDFGSTFNAKLAGRRALTDSVAIRAAVSTGFRAPTPGQQNAFNVTTAFDPETGGLSNQGTVPSSSPAAALRGGEPLQPEEAMNYSAGLVITKGDFTLTADLFSIDVDDRLSLSKTFRQCALRNEPDCVTEAEIEGLLPVFPEARNLRSFRFFVNDFSTQTQGLDIVGTYTPSAWGGNTTFSLVYNHTNTEVTTPPSDTISTYRIATLEDGLPDTRWNVSMTHAAERFNLMARLHYFGGWWDSEDANNWLGRSLAHTYDEYSGEYLLDVEVGVPLRDQMSLAIGAQNLLNEYPDEHPYAAAGVGNRYGQFSPFGFNGAYYYLRLNYSWGTSF